MDAGALVRMTETTPPRHETRRSAGSGAAGELLRRHRAGDRRAFAELVAQYRAPIYSYLVRCGVAAGERDDLFQEVFLRIHRAAASYDERRPAHPWIFTIAANTLRSHLRRQRVRRLVFGDRRGADPEAPPPEPADPAPDGERRAAARQDAALVEREIARLPVGQRQVVLLAGVERLKLKEVAAALGMPLNTVKTNLRRGRLALARALARRHGVTP